MMHVTVKHGTRQMRMQWRTNMVDMLWSASASLMSGPAWQLPEEAASVC
jgi:hypothetical protein